VPATPRIRFELSLIAASAKGDNRGGTAGGIGLQVGFLVGSDIDLFAGCRYLANEFPAGGSIPGEYFEVSHRELQVGLRFTAPVSPSAKAFLEGNVHSAKREVTFQPEDTSGSESGAGMGVRIGVIYMVGSKIGLGAAGSLSASNLSHNSDPGTFSDAWMAGDLFLNAWF
jgi:hypothetical protein